MSEFLTGLFMLVGALLMLVASIGILRMPDLLIRMHATTKAGALGGGLMVLSVAFFFDEGAVTARAVATVIFIILTAPVAAHIIGRAAYFVGLPLWEHTVKDDLKGRYDPETHKLSSSGPADEQKPG